MGKNNRFEKADQPKPDEPKADDQQKVTSLTYMPLPEDRDEVTVGGVLFKAYEPVEINEDQARRVAHLANNPFFSGNGEIDDERKSKWQALRNARRDMANQEQEHAKAKADTAGLVKNVNLRPVDPSSPPFDPDRPAWGGPTNNNATSHQIEDDRVKREAEASASDGTDIRLPLPGHDVWYWPAYNADLPVQHQPLAAKIARVIHGRRVNLMVINPDGLPFSARDVQLLQNDDQAPRTAYCEWTREPKRRNEGAKEDDHLRGSQELHDPPHQTGLPEVEIEGAKY